MSLATTTFATLDQVQITDQLQQRDARVVSDEQLNAGILELVRLLSHTPANVLQHLVETALELCEADTVGISLLEREDGRDIFRWRAIAGTLAGALGLSVARDASPCGMVLDRGDKMLFTYPEKHFSFPGPVDQPIVDALLVPFYDQDEPVGTLWVVAHDDARKFDGGDVKILEELCGFTTSAYSELRQLGYVEDLRKWRDPT